MNRNARHRRRRQSLRSQMRELQRAAHDVVRLHTGEAGTFATSGAQRWHALQALAALLPARRPR